MKPLKKSRKWNPQVTAAIRQSRKAWGDWKLAGKPDKDDSPTCHRNIKEAKTNLRKSIRKTNAKDRETKLQAIMDAENNTKSFHTLVRMQRKSNCQQTNSLMVDGVNFESPREICDGWSSHFKTLATPKQSQRWNAIYTSSVNDDLVHIESICNLQHNPIKPASLAEIKKALKCLKNNKAADSFGLTSEHFILSSPYIETSLLYIINNIFRQKKVPDILKEGLLTPVYKKGDTSNPSNYRGISVTPILLKVLQLVLNNRHNLTLKHSQSRLQKGFTEKTSSMNAALVLTECISEAKSQKKPMYIAALDVQKAFDVVNHQFLLHKLYADGITGDDWLLMKDLYSNMTARVKWEGHLSSPFIIKQGVRQGGILSATHYKRYNNPLLLDIEDRFTGKTIGTVKVPHVTCADDLCYVTDSKNELQPMISTSEGYANREHYTIHPTKTVIVPYNTQDVPSITLYGEKVPVMNQTVHLGIYRNSKCNFNIDEKINIGRRTAYSLMGAGFHGRSGTKQSIKADMWRKYVIPRLIYGLEVQNLKKKDITALEAFQIRCAKQLQGLPTKTSNSATMALLGLLPIEACINKCVLTLFCNVVRDPQCIEYDIARRQLAVKSPNDTSFFSKVRNILDLYSLPTAYSVVETAPTREQWKKCVKSGIHQYTETLWREDIESKSTLRYLNPDSVKVGRVHQVYAYVNNSTFDIRRAEMKARLLTGTYTLQATRARFNQFCVNPQCPLCKQEPENRVHFLVICQTLKDIRFPYIKKIRDLFGCSRNIDHVLRNPELCTQLLLDSSHPSVALHLDITERQTEILELRSRELIYELHLNRARLLNTE